MPRGVYKRTKPAWNKGLTKETDERVRLNAEHTKKTVQERYGVSTVFQSKDVLDKLSEERHSGKLAQKAMQTKLERYGNSNYNNMEKQYQTKLERYGDPYYNNYEKFIETSYERYGTQHPNQAKINKDKISNSRIKNNSQEKAKITIINRYGSIENYYKIVSEKRYETMKQNGTLGYIETKPEKEYYQYLIDMYGEDDIIKQYYDKERYPFRCDFYILSEDKFIELNGFITHGPHPFDENSEEDQKLLEELKNKNDDWSKAIIYTWTDLDVRKLKTAKENNLNFEVIYWYNR